jgi:protein-tyrosine phosphatase
MAAGMTERVLTLQGIHNVRDYGCYAAVGGWLRSGLLWRSGQHGAATPEDLAAVAALDLRTVIDLRGDAERAVAPCLRPMGFAGEVLFAPGETAGSELAPHEEAGRGIASADEARAAMRRLYANMPFRAVLVGTLRLYFEALATRDGASLVHCLAGKDRTGLAVALFHTLVGVHPDDRMADYLLTMTAGDPARRVADAAPAIRARYGAMDDATIGALMGVEADYLATAFAAIDERYGNVERYAEDMLGVDARRRELLRMRFVV